MSKPNHHKAINMAFDPFTAVLGEAMDQPNADAPQGALQQWGAAQSIKDGRERFEKNPIDGIAACVRAGITAPDWLAVAFLRQYDKVLNCKVQTWDEAFGPPHPPRKHLSTLRLRRLYSTAVYRLFIGPDRLPRTREGRAEAARQLSITEKQVRMLLPPTRTNVKGHKPYATRSTSDSVAHDPFSIASKRTPKI